jgi:hypothetical protein
MTAGRAHLDPSPDRRTLDCGRAPAKPRIGCALRNPLGGAKRDDLRDGTAFVVSLRSLSGGLAAQRGWRQRIMPSNRKKRIRERMAKTGEPHAAARLALSRKQRITHGKYAGRPNLPEGPSTEYFDAEGRHLPGVRFPQFELVSIQGDFDPIDLKKCWVPESMFDDPEMLHNVGWPRDVKRALTLAEYIDARVEQTGWVLQRIDPNTTEFMGRILTLMVKLQWGPGRSDSAGGTR